MAKKLLKLTVASVSEPLFDGEVESVTVPGVDGEMTLLAHHEAFISPLKKGVVTVRSESDSHEFDIESGMLEVSDNTATILV